MSVGFETSKVVNGDLFCKPRGFFEIYEELLDTFHAN